MIKKTQAEHKTFVYSESDYLIIHHFLIYGDQTKAYAFGRESRKKVTKQSLYNMASNYFNKNEIKVLLSIEVETFKQKVLDWVHKYELKKPDSMDPNEFYKKELQTIGDISKDEAIKIITKALLNAKTDPKTIKDLIPNLMRLNSWDKETDQDSSNIVTYHLPI